LFIGADLGDVQLAANQVLLQFLHITAFALDGFAFSAEALVGGAVGAKNRLRMRQAAYMASLWAVGSSVVLTVGFYVLGGVIIDIMTTSPEVREAARVFLIWAALAPLLSVASYMLDGVFIGATWTRDMRIAMIQSVGLYVVALVVLVPSFGNHGLWAALMVLNVTRAVTLALRYSRLEAQLAA
jgi:MATE family multidrug resistance protein